MMRRVFSLIVFGLVTCTAGTAGAAPILIGSFQTWLYDGTSAGCSTCSATVVFELLGATSLKISFENTSTDGFAGVNILTGVGFDTNPNLNSISILSQSIEGGKTWKLGNGVGSGTWEIGLVKGQGINDGLDNQLSTADSGYIVLGWSTPSIAGGGLNIDRSLAKFQAVGPNGISIGAPGTPVPEPGTFLLFACGFGWAIHKRRRFSL